MGGDSCGVTSNNVIEGGPVHVLYGCAAGDCYRGVPAAMVREVCQLQGIWGCANCNAYGGVPTAMVIEV